MVLAVVCFIPGAILLIASFFAFFSNQGTVGAVMLALALLFLTPVSRQNGLREFSFM